MLDTFLITMCNGSGSLAFGSKFWYSWKWSLARNWQKPLSTFAYAVESVWVLWLRNVAQTDTWYVWRCASSDKWEFPWCINNSKQYRLVSTSGRSSCHHFLHQDRNYRTPRYCQAIPFIQHTYSISYVLYAVNLDLAEQSRSIGLRSLQSSRLID